MTSATPTAIEKTEPAIVVTGASSGIGRAIARLAAGKQMPMLLVARSGDMLKTVADELASNATEVAWLSVDLRDRDAGERIVRALADHGWHCDILVFGAGHGVLGPSHIVDRSEQMATIDVNVRALTELALRLLPGMIARRRGGVLALGSTAGYFSGPNMAAYYASKAYVRSFCDAMYAETRGLGVTITNLSPGLVSTLFLDRSGIGQTRLRRIFPPMRSAEVAEAGWQGFILRRRVVIPGLTNRVMVRIARFMPAGVLLWVFHVLQRSPSKAKLRHPDQTDRAKLPAE